MNIVLGKSHGSVKLVDGRTIKTHVCEQYRNTLRTSFGTFRREFAGGSWHWVVDKRVEFTWGE